MLPHAQRDRAQRPIDGRFTLMPSTSGQAPGATVMAPLGSVLQKHAVLFVEDEQSRCTETAPVTLPRRRLDPGIARIAWVRR